MTNHPASVHPDLIVGLATSDDAGVYSLGDGRALIQSVDIFTPVVDSPADWGRIAAANALSDIYAMGGVPMTAMQYLGWPRGELPFEVASDVISAGMSVMGTAGCTVVGGHSIDSPEPTYGFAVTGIAQLDQVVTNGSGQPDDVLLLTKPVGTGIVTTAIKRGACGDDVASEAIDVMATLNREAGEALHDHEVHAATDITGFGLVGHLLEMCRASGVGAVIDVDSVPLLPGVNDLVARGMWPGGSKRNMAAFRSETVSDLDDATLKPLFDAQTSGGLLVALPASRVAAYVELVPAARPIGKLTSNKGIVLT